MVGVEVDWIRPSSAEYISDLLKKYPLDTLIGAIHHVHAKPIDFDHSLFAEAREISGGNDENIFKDYFDLQYEMLRALKPPIVGHFDVIRMKADYPGSSFMQFPGVWHKILRNLDFVVQYGGILELNSAALRKGMDEPYPKAEICRVNRCCVTPTPPIADRVHRCSSRREGSSRYQTTVMASTKWARTTINYSHSLKRLVSRTLSILRRDLRQEIADSLTFR